MTSGGYNIMNIKKISAILLIMMLTLSNISFAARGGARAPSFKAPAVTAPKTTAPKSSTGTEKAYEPSKNVASLSEKNPAAKNTIDKNTTNTTSSRWGGILRNASIFAGGMFLGGLLSHLFGWGGFMGGILGTVANIAILLLLIMLAINIWRKLTKRNKQENPYRSDIAQQKRETKIIDITPPPEKKSYDSHSKAEEYRKK